MLYPKNSENQLSQNLFENPTSEYRGTPFWAWNCQLTPDMLERQIDCLKEMGFGGFHMHSRVGLSTPYLGEEFMGLVKTCVEKARTEKMLAWLYDEDRWPSGAAGGLVTEIPEYRERYLFLSPAPLELVSQDGGTRTLIAKYDISLDASGCLSGHKMLGENDTGENTWYAYMEIAGTDPWYNDQAYLNTLDKKAVDEFIKITHEAYKKAVGDDFGGVIPAIFTDEPQFTGKTRLNYATEKRMVRLPWTDDLPDTYRAAYNDELLPKLPEIIWELPKDGISQTRYRYHDHIAQRFADAFANNCGDWCRANGLKLTGHMNDEPTLHSQTDSLGDAMRSYSGFDLPGIDMLSDTREYNTAKQAQSAAHQYGREGVLSELYGVTNWDFDFRGHKLQGDWQAALGVTVRVPHLSWVSMEGEAKRDYPASINYQAPWYKEYPLIEDHFARVNTAMTRGKPVVRVGVIHPIESYWLHWGPSEQTNDIREQMESNYENLTRWLLFGQIDFDFIDEALFPSLCENGGAPLTVGEMNYDAVIIPACQTLRSSTAKRLQQFKESGGQLIVMGNPPCYVDASAPGSQLDFLKNAKNITFDRYSILKELSPVREIEILDKNGVRAENFVTQLRQDGSKRWAFIANGTLPFNTDVTETREYTIHVAGEWNISLYDTMTGKTYALNTGFDGVRTTFKRAIYIHDSLLLCLSRETAAHAPAPCVRPITYSDEGLLAKVPVALSEPNALLLDMAEYAFDGGEYQPADEILRIDKKFREALGLPLRMDAMVQPWVIAPEKPEHSVSLKFTIQSEIEVPEISLALECAGDTAIVFNGTPVPSTATGWYVDESIKTVALPGLNTGTNTLELTMPFGKRTNLEWCYLLGDFGVRVSGMEKTVTSPVRELNFGDITGQGLPFYGGNILYKLAVESDGGDLTIQAPHYRGGLIGVLVDGKRVGDIVFDPYSFTIPKLAKGKHEIGLLFFGTRVNTFGAVHNCESTCVWFGPTAWRTTGREWSYEYVLKPQGITRSPGIIKG